MVLQLQHVQSKEDSNCEKGVAGCVDVRGKHCACMKVTLWINLRPINGGQCCVPTALSAK